MSIVNVDSTQLSEVVSEASYLNGNLSRGVQVLLMKFVGLKMDIKFFFEVPSLCRM